MYVEVLLPLALKDVLSYRVPPSMREGIRLGMRVSVEVGRNKTYAGLVRRIHEDEPGEETTLKPVTAVLDREPVVTATQMQLWEWISDYYMCPPGQVMSYFFPSSMKMQHRTEGEMPVYLFERERRMEKAVFLSLHPALSPEGMHTVLDSLKRAPNQSRALTFVLEKMFESESSPGLFEIRKTELTASGIFSSAIGELVKRGILVSKEAYVESKYEEESASVETLPAPPVLNAPQQTALEEIQRAFSAAKTVLLFGVSGSGKTEVYMHRIRETLSKGEQVLLLIPELAATAALFQRLQRYFGDRMIEYTSRQTPAARYRIYNRLLHASQGILVVGTRSALSLPFSRLKLIVVDDEHDAGYKQHDPAPRFHARDTAVMAGRLYGADVLLASATPSVESYFNALQHKYALVSLNEKFNGTPPPRITVIERRLIAVKEKKENGYGPDTRYFSRYLLRRIGETLAEGGQAILFQNRRGFSSYIECLECGHIPQCPACNVSLTYHKNQDMLECHYCGVRIPWRQDCLQCGSKNVQLQGIGTENIEERIHPYFPEARIVRMDADTLRARGRFENLAARIRSGDADIIVGTQIIGKGFDFPKVSLVGVINADNMFGFPDFRASERGFQTLFQMAGRLSGSEKRGEMIIQSNLSQGSVIGDLKTLSYTSMYAREIRDRERFLFPPFVRMVEFTFRHPDPVMLETAVKAYAVRLEELFGSRVSAPVVPTVNRIRGIYLMQIVLKIEKTRSVERAKRWIAALNESMRKDALFKGVSVVVNVDV